MLRSSSGLLSAPLSSLTRMSTTRVAPLIVNQVSRSFSNGHVTDMGGSFKERERALEEKYFREIEARLLKNLSEHPELFKKAVEHAEKHVEAKVASNVSNAASASSKPTISQDEFEKFKTEMFEKLKELESRVAK